jgi:2,3-diketo-5-methylthio-1-phosphopentane phosphatase
MVHRTDGGKNFTNTKSSSHVSKSHVSCHVFVDFDGTISPVDTTDRLLERFADPAWREIEEDWRAGRIGSRECMVRQIDLVRATPAQLSALLAEIEIDPAFPDFVELVQAQGAGLTVVSDGLDANVAAVLKAAGLDLPYRANQLEWLGGDRWRLGFPHSRSDCRVLSGTCKCGLAPSPTETVSVLVGDGRSDFCFAAHAELVLAKGSLAAHCRAEGIAHHPFRSFAEATAILARWFEAEALGSDASGVAVGDE